MQTRIRKGQDRNLFSYIKGTLEEYWEDTIVVESGGIGWNIHVPLSVLDRLPHVGEQIKVYTSFQVKEDSMTLYGFFSRQDLKMFNQLLGVTGIGPKAALGILSSLSPDDLRMAIIAEDSKAIAKAPGIGPKTAKRVILDLKDKISMDEVLPLQFTGGQTEAASYGSSFRRGWRRQRGHRSTGCPGLFPNRSHKGGAAGNHHGGHEFGSGAEGITEISGILV